MSSRLAQDSSGRMVAVISVRTLPDVEFGHHYLVLGDTIAAGASSVRFFFLANETRRASRPASGREQLESQRHAPYNPSHSRKSREQQQVPDDELAEQAAIELARREQQREPADLIGRAA